MVCSSLFLLIQSSFCKSTLAEGLSCFRSITVCIECVILSDPVSNCTVRHCLHFSCYRELQLREVKPLAQSFIAYKLQNIDSTTVILTPWPGKRSPEIQCGRHPLLLNECPCFLHWSATVYSIKFFIHRNLQTFRGLSSWHFENLQSVFRYHLRGVRSELGYGVCLFIEHHNEAEFMTHPKTNRVWLPSQFCGDQTWGVMKMAFE